MTTIIRDPKNKPEKKPVNERKSFAKQAWFWYFLMRISDVYCLLFFLFQIVGKNPSKTAINIQKSDWFYGLNIVGNLFSQCCFIFLVLALNNIFKKENSQLSRLMLLLAIISVPVLLMHTLCLAGAQMFVGKPNYLTVFDIKYLDTFAFGLIKLYGNGLVFVKLFWALYIIPLGILVIKSKYFHNIIGRLMFITSFFYLANTIASVLNAKGQYLFLELLTIITVGELLIVLIFFVNHPKTQFQY